MVWYFFPAFYSSQSDRSQGLPIITQAGFDVSSASSGNPLSFSITTFNQGRPNLSGDISKEEIDPSRGYVKVKDYNFTQSPLFVASGDTVGKEYWGAETTTAKYPSIEYFSRPWKPRLDTVQLLKFLLTPFVAIYPIYINEKGNVELKSLQLYYGELLAICKNVN